MMEWAHKFGDVLVLMFKYRAAAYMSLEACSCRLCYNYVADTAQWIEAAGANYFLAS